AAVTRGDEAGAQGGEWTETSQQGTRPCADQSAGSRQADCADSDRDSRLAAGRGGFRALAGRIRAVVVDPARQGPQQAGCGRRPSARPGESTRGLPARFRQGFAHRNEEKCRRLCVVRGSATRRECDPQVACNTAHAARISTRLMDRYTLAEIPEDSAIPNPAASSDGIGLPRVPATPAGAMKIIA